MEQTTSHVVSTNSSVLNSTTLLASPSQPKKVEGKKVPLVGKIPVVISEADVQVYVDATIQLEEPALEITRVKKNVFLTRSQLLLTDDKKSAKLLISGFVRNCIEYSTARHVGQSAVSGKIRFTVVNVPFKCFTKVDFITEPESASNPQPYTSSAMSHDGFGSDQFALSITNSEILNEKIYCELIESKIRQVDLKKDIQTLTQACGRHTNERTFKAFLESMVIELKLRVMQNQSVFISPILASGDGKSGGGKGGNDCGKGGNDDNKGGNDCSKGGNDCGKGGNSGGKGGNDGGKGGNDGGKGGNNGGKGGNNGGKGGNDGGKGGNSGGKGGNDGGKGGNDGGKDRNDGGKDSKNGKSEDNGSKNRNDSKSEDNSGNSDKSDEDKEQKEDSKKDDRSDENDKEKDNDDKDDNKESWDQQDNNKWEN